MKEKIILIGGGGHCKSCIDVIQSTGLYDIAGIVEHSGFHLTSPRQEIMGIKIIGTDDDLPELVIQYPHFLITLGQIKTARVRIQLFETVKGLGGHFPVIVSPWAHLSPHAKVGEGTIVMHQALVNAEAVVGLNCIINTGSLIEHEAFVGDHTHISTHAIVNGQVRIGSRTLIGSGTVTANNISVPDDTLVAAGSVVLRSLENPGTYIGNPLRKIR